MNQRSTVPIPILPGTTTQRWCLRGLTSRATSCRRRVSHDTKVEAAVQLAERWILAALRNRQFFSLAELNAAIRELLDKLNSRVTRHLGNSRSRLFEELDKPKLKALPQEPYEFAAWKECRAGIDYHVVSETRGAR